MAKNKTYGIDIKSSIFGLTEKPKNWEEIKDGFTQAHGCKNCGNRWSEQLDWNTPAINSVRMHDYCSDCYEDNKELLREII